MLTATGQDLVSMKQTAAGRKKSKVLWNPGILSPHRHVGKSQWSKDAVYQIILWKNQMLITKATIILCIRWSLEKPMPFLSILLRLFFSTHFFAVSNTHFGEGAHLVGKEYTEGIEGNNCRLRHRIGRALRKTYCFSRKLLNHLKAFDMAFFYINYGFVWGLSYFVDHFLQSLYQMVKVKLIVHPGFHVLVY
jgi:hypothetical protein